MELTTAIRYSGSTRAWNDLTDSVVDPIEPDLARQRHEHGAEYGAVVPVGGALAVVSMIGTDKAQVNFHGLPGTLLYAFDAVDSRLWLREIQRRNGHGRYGKNGFPPSTCADFYRWPDPDSPATIARFDAETPKGRLVAERTEWDPEPNWFDWPDFGDYETLVDLDLLSRRARLAAAASERDVNAPDQPHATKVAAALQSARTGGGGDMDTVDSAGVELSWVPPVSFGDYRWVLDPR